MQEPLSESNLASISKLMAVKKHPEYLEQAETLTNSTGLLPFLLQAKNFTSTQKPSLGLTYARQPRTGIDYELIDMLDIKKNIPKLIIP